MTAQQITPTDSDRVRSNTPEGAQQEIDQETAQRVDACAARGPDAIARRLRELDDESDIERLLEINASTLALGGLTLGAVAGRRWLAVPFVVLPFLLQHGIQGWCPPLPVLRRMGIRTRGEIDAERYALKALRGDFDRVRGGSAAEAFAAVRA